MSRESAIRRADLVFARAFAPELQRTPRSDAYKQGVRAQLARLDNEAVGPCPYHLGTPEADAWLAGGEEGRALTVQELLS